VHVAKLLSYKSDPKSAFQSWTEQFGKTYEAVQEYEHRFGVWLENLEYVIAHNARGASYWLGMTSLADITHQEYRERTFGFRADLAEQAQKAKAASSLGAAPFRYAETSPPAEVDWVKKGAVTKVKNQQQCGSCWAFSTTGSIEAANQIFSGDLLSLSEQELVDCDVLQDHGCNGGLMDYAFTFIENNGGIDTEKDYAYNAMQGTCDVGKRDRHVVTIDGHEDVPPNDELSLMKAVANQPVSVAIEADERDFQLYAGGVYDAPCGTALDHGVLVVGYGHDKTADGTVKPFWKVKNSWGQAWGEEGYIRLVRNLGAPGASPGQCGIAMIASYPVKTTPNPPKPAPPGPKPPGPAPGPDPPVPCDDAGTTSCPSGSTCCCMSSFFSFCFSWACCPLPKATCCEDGQHCCPSNLPTCDTTAGRCTKGPAAGLEGSQPWVRKQPAIRNTAGRSWVPHAPRIPAWARQFTEASREAEEGEVATS